MIYLTKPERYGWFGGRRGPSFFLYPRWNEGCEQVADFSELLSDQQEEAALSTLEALPRGCGKGLGG